MRDSCPAYRSRTAGTPAFVVSNIHVVPMVELQLRIGKSRVPISSSNMAWAQTSAIPMAGFRIR